MDCKAATSWASMSSLSWRLYEIFKPSYLNVRKKATLLLETLILAVSGRASYLASSQAMQALSDSRTWVHRADGGAGYDSHGSLARPLVSHGEEQTSLSLKNLVGGGGE